MCDQSLVLKLWCFLAIKFLKLQRLLCKQLRRYRWRQRNNFYRIRLKKALYMFFCISCFFLDNYIIGALLLVLFGVIFAAYKSLVSRKSPNEKTGHPVETHKTSESGQKTMDHRLVCVLCMYWVDIHEIYFVRNLLHFLYFSLTNQSRSME